MRRLAVRGVIRRGDGVATFRERSTLLVVSASLAERQKNEARCRRLLSLSTGIGQ